MRADEHEGPLSDTQVRREKDRLEKEANKIIREDRFAFTENTQFLRWFGRWIVPVLTQHFPVNNGSMLAQFMGERDVLLRMAEDLDIASPGFLLRVMEARKNFEARLEAAALDEKEQ